MARMGEGATAARIAWFYETRIKYGQLFLGARDWHLPSIRELGELKPHREAVGFSSHGCWWSSSEAYPEDAYSYVFHTPETQPPDEPKGGFSNYGPKSGSFGCFVLPVRAFG